LERVVRHQGRGERRRGGPSAVASLVASASRAESPASALALPDRRTPLVAEMTLPESLVKAVDKMGGIDSPGPLGHFNPVASRRKTVYATNSQQLAAFTLV